MGPSDHEKSPFLTMRTWEVLTKLVTEGGANVFLFNNGGQFDRDCWEIVSQLKMHHPNIELHYYHSGCDYDVGYVDYQMIDKCDVLVTYYYLLQLEEKPNDPAVLAVKYAQEKNKNVINLYDLLFQYIPFTIN